MTTPHNDGSSLEHWYYADSSDTPQGPHTLEELHRLAAAKTIGRQTMIVKLGGKKWVPYETMLPGGRSIVGKPSLPPPLPSKPSSRGKLWPILAAFTLPLVGMLFVFFSKRLNLKEKALATFANLLVCSVIAPSDNVGPSADASSQTPSAAVVATSQPAESSLPRATPDTREEAPAEFIAEMAKTVEAIQKNVEEVVATLESTYAASKDNPSQTIPLRKTRNTISTLQTRIKAAHEQTEPYQRQSVSWIQDALGEQEIVLRTAGVFLLNINREEASKHLGETKWYLTVSQRAVADIHQPDVALAKRNAKKDLWKRSLQVSRSRRKEIQPNPNAKAQPYTIVHSEMEPSQSGQRRGYFQIVSPSASCFEEYALTVQQAAKDIVESNGLESVSGSLLPSKDSDRDFYIAAVNYKAGVDQSKMSITAVKAPPTQKEIEISEAWKRVRAETPSNHEDEIQEKLVAEWIATSEEITLAMQVMMTREEFTATEAIRKNVSQASSTNESAPLHAYMLAYIHAGGEVPHDHPSIARFDRLLKDICRIKGITMDEASEQTVTAVAYMQSKNVKVDLLKFMEAVRKIVAKSDADMTYAEMLKFSSDTVIADTHGRRN